MYMETKAHMNYWSTENFCGRWTLRTGTLFIASITTSPSRLQIGNIDQRSIFPRSCQSSSMKWTQGCGALFGRVCPVPRPETAALDPEVWSLSSVLWCVAVLFCFADGRQEYCWFTPGPEIETIHKIFSEEQASEAQRIIFICVIIYLTLYFIVSIMVFTGVFKKLPSLLSPWVGLTNIHMVVVLADLLLTLAFTTLLHLLITLAHFVAALCAWVVVKSHRQQLRVLRSRPPLPEHALLDYTVDGVDKIALDPVP